MWGKHSVNVSYVGVYLCANEYVKGLELPRRYLAVTVLSLYSLTLCRGSSFSASCVFPALSQQEAEEGVSLPHATLIFRTWHE